MTIDVHQHLWPAPLVEALRERTAPPRLHDWTLELPGEAPRALDPADHDPVQRTAQVRADGLEVALIALPGELGIEQLPVGESAELLAAYHEGVRALPPVFRAWASAAVLDPDPTDLATQLDRGCAGLQLPATALLDGDCYERVAPLLELLGTRERPLFIHPGPAPSRRGPAGWWPAIVGEVQQMHAAWYAFRVLGRPRFPRLRVCFAMLAGLAPLHGERYRARTGERTVVDELAFLETSSYGPRAVDAIVRVLGIDVVVHGSDRPHGEPGDPGFGDAARFAVCTANPTRLFEQEVSHELATAAVAQS